jgi:hypothetical protein
VTAGAMSSAELTAPTRKGRRMDRIPPPKKTH